MLRLPHPEFAALIDTIKRDVIRREEIVLIDVAISYAVFRSEAETRDFAFYDEAFYDEQGTIYISENLLHFNEQYAHLSALHEHVEIQHKRAGRPHAYAHRHALLTELLAAKQIFSEAHHLTTYLQWRIGLYPEWKHLDQAAIVMQLLDLLTSNRPRKGALFQRIREYML
jgi:hypothetical protein